MSPDDLRHGTNPGYNLGCRDECCRHAHMVWMKRYRLYGGTSTVDALGFDRRVKALMAIGYTGRTISAAIGRSKSFVDATLGQPRIRRVTHELMAEAYERLCMTPVEGWVGDRARRRAAALGFAPPLAWDNIDDPDERPKLGVHRKRDTLAEYRWLLDGGVSHFSAVQQLGISEAAVLRAIEREKEAA